MCIISKHKVRHWFAYLNVKIGALGLELAGSVSEHRIMLSMILCWRIIALLIELLLLC